MTSAQFRLALRKHFFIDDQINNKAETVDLITSLIPDSNLSLQLRWLNWLGNTLYLESFDPKRYHALHKKIDTRVNKVLKNKKGLLTKEEFDVVVDSVSSGYADRNKNIINYVFENILFERDERILTARGGPLMRELFTGRLITN